MVEQTSLERINMLERSYLMHSFLYYKLDQTLIDDIEYDNLWKQLVNAVMENPKAAKESVYWDLCKNIVLQDMSSGAFIKSYPPEIATTALRMLWYSTQKKESFIDFIRPWGYYI